jgi:hypothetical protein
MKDEAEGNGTRFTSRRFPVETEENDKNLPG